MSTLTDSWSFLLRPIYGLFMISLHYCPYRACNFIGDTRLMLCPFSHTFSMQLITTTLRTIRQTLGCMQWVLTNRTTSGQQP